MSTKSLSPQSAGSMNLSGLHSPINWDGTPRRMFDPRELERRLRNITPDPDNCVERWKAEVKRNHDKLIALGGRPTRPILPRFICKTTMVDGMHDSRDEDRKVDVIAEVDVTSEDDGPAASHWSEELAKWEEEVDRWQNFKEAQRINNQLDRLETDLELENTDVGLVEVLSKLNDWQEFQFFQQKKVHEAERLHEQCQQGIARLQNKIVAARAAEPTREIQGPDEGWMRQMRRAQERLEASQEELMWVKSEWTEVLAEISHAIAAAPKLQKQLEDKLERQTNTIYRCLQQRGARSSHAVHSPDDNAAFSQRLQHWISESAVYTAELWDWRIFMAWRRHVKGTDAIGKEGQKQPSQVDSCSELFEDLVKYRQYELDRAISWVDCWRCRARDDAEANKSTSLQERKGFMWVDEEYEEAQALSDEEPEATEVEQAQIYARHAEQKVSDATERLERSKKELQIVLAECDHASTEAIPAEDSGAQLPPTPPKSKSPQSLTKNRRTSNEKSSSAEKGYRRSKKEKARKEGAKMNNNNAKQQALPIFSLIPKEVAKDDDIEMSDIPEGPRLEIIGKLKETESEDTLLSNVEDPPNCTSSFLSSSKSQSRPTTNTGFRNSPSPSAQDPTSRKTRSATKLDQALSGRVSKNKTTKAKVFTERVMNAVSTSYPSTNSVSLRRSKRLKEKAAASKKRVCT